MSLMTQVNDMLTEVIKQQLELHHMNYYQLAELADIPLETMRNIYYGKTKDPKASTLLAIARVFKVSMNYLMGEGFISDEEKYLLHHYRECGTHGKSMIHLVAKYEAAVAKKERSSKGKHKIPCLMPLGHVVDGIQYSSSESIEIETAVPEAFFAIEITNNNFSPVYCKGDRILLQDRFPEHGERAFFTVNNYIYCRQYIEDKGRYVLKSFNKHGQHMEFKRMDAVECIGTCIDVIRA